MRIKGEHSISLRMDGSALSEHIYSIAKDETLNPQNIAIFSDDLGMVIESHCHAVAIHIQVTPNSNIRENDYDEACCGFFDHLIEAFHNNCYYNDRSEPCKLVVRHFYRVVDESYLRAPALHLVAFCSHHAGTAHWIPNSMRQTGDSSGEFLGSSAYAFISQMVEDSWARSMRIAPIQDAREIHFPLERVFQLDGSSPQIFWQFPHAIVKLSHLANTKFDFNGWTAAIINDGDAKPTDDLGDSVE